MEGGGEGIKCIFNILSDNLLFNHFLATKVILKIEILFVKTFTL